ncbi:MAG TPA: hypothetical protein VFA18_03925, partial [Gemmataceae bacterium]|nr:hypothetical protein [Gemmataceae bacterium]
ADWTCLEAMRVHLPRATPAVMVQFEQAARTHLVSMAQKDGIAVLDLAAVMDGRGECFADLVHFTDTGAARVADYLAGQLPQHAVQ